MEYSSDVIRANGILTYEDGDLHRIESRKKPVLVGRATDRIARKRPYTGRTEPSRYFYPARRLTALHGPNGRHYGDSRVLRSIRPRGFGSIRTGHMMKK